MLNLFYLYRQLQFSLVQSRPTLCHPLDCSTPGFPVHPLTPGACSNSCPLSGWYHPTIASSVISFSSCLQSFPSIRVLSNESVLPIRWPKYWSFSFSISPSNEYSGQNWTPKEWAINYYKVNFEKNWQYFLAHPMGAWTSLLHSGEILTSLVISHTVVYSWTKYSVSQTCSLLHLRTRELNKVA